MTSEVVLFFIFTVMTNQRSSLHIFMMFCLFGSQRYGNRSDDPVAECNPREESFSLSGGLMALCVVMLSCDS